MESLHKNIQLMLEFLNGPLFVLHFSYYINDFPDDVICNITIYALMILLCILNVIRHLICGNNWNQLLNLNLIDQTLQTGAGTGLLISSNTGAIDVKMDGSVLEENSSLIKMLGLTFTYKLDQGSYIISTAKTSSKKMEPSFIL